MTKGQDVVNDIAQGDQIESIDILDSTAPLFAAQARRSRSGKFNELSIRPNTKERSAKAESRKVGRDPFDVSSRL